MQSRRQLDFNSESIYSYRSESRYFIGMEILVRLFKIFIAENSPICEPWRIKDDCS